MTTDLIKTKTFRASLTLLQVMLPLTGVRNILYNIFVVMCRPTHSCSLQFLSIIILLIPLSYPVNVN